MSTLAGKIKKHGQGGAAGSNSFRSERRKKDMQREEKYIHGRRIKRKVEKVSSSVVKE